MGWAATAFSSVGSLVGGIFGDQGAQAEAAQYKFNAKSELIAADEDSASRLSDLNSTLSSINAIRTSRGLDVASPTGMAISQSITKQSDANIQAARLNYATRAQSDLFGAYNAQQKGTADLLGGFLGGAKTVADYGNTQHWWG